ncbi:MAG TPA: metallophosphoesterase family protein, partial [Thermoanaerobaculia bacterium]
MSDMTRLALIGGIYSNYHALVATLSDIAQRGADATWFLGDLGAFGPYPDRIPDLLIDRNVPGIQGNYEESLSSGADDCHCGYTDPRDNFYAQISYDYTAKNTSDSHKKWMGTLPKSVRLDVGGTRILLSHGSPRKINEFLWRSTSPDPFLEKMCEDFASDVIVCTHSGLHWHKRLTGNRHIVNAGVIGRPANDGKTNVWYTMLTISGSQVDVEFIPIEYDHDALAQEMRTERL